MVERLEGLFLELIGICKKLRGKDGCPWDRKQNLQTIKGMLREECYEVLESMDGRSWDELEEELGDLLYHIIFVTQLADEEDKFNFEEVLEGIIDKLIRRHPHVFKDAKISSGEEVIKNWTKIKSMEKEKTGKGKTNKSILGDIPKSMPALARAQRVSERASRVGFDWASEREILEKVEEELQELKLTMDIDDDSLGFGEELGDVLFTIVNLARFRGLDCEDLMNRATRQFEDRFNFMERDLKDKGKDIFKTPMEELDVLWEKAKRREVTKMRRNSNR